MGNTGVKKDVILWFVSPGGVGGELQAELSRAPQSLGAYLGPVLPAQPPHLWSPAVGSD